VFARTHVSSKRERPAWDHLTMHVFISYNHHDRKTARRLGGQLRLVGGDVWFDEWEVKAGDSIPGKVNDALAAVDTVVLVWSTQANRSAWVRAELETAIARAIDDDGFRVITVRLDSTLPPPLLRRLKWIDLIDEDVGRAVNEIMGFANDQQRLLAIQGALDEAAIEVRYFQGYGTVVCCPQCGAKVSRLRGWSQTDVERDDTYAGMRCDDCGFEDGGEI
jgi:DNA-directed RNA polymerase subunit RPC12/RpoP